METQYIILYLIDSCLSKGFPSQLHEASRKCIGMILALRVYVRVVQSVEYELITANRFICEHRGFESHCVLLFFRLFPFFYFISFVSLFLIYFIIFYNIMFYFNSFFFQII